MPTTTFTISAPAPTAPASRPTARRFRSSVRAATCCRASAKSTRRWSRRTWDCPFVQKVSIDVSARYDKYSDVGPTFNPKYGIDWVVTDDIKFRGNYSTSFVAVPVGISGDPSQGGEFGGGASIAPLSPVPVSAFPSGHHIPGCAGLAAGQSCNLGTSTNPGLIRQYGSALANARPQRGNGINVGSDFTPTFLPGLTLDMSFLPPALQRRHHRAQPHPDRQHGFGELPADAVPHRLHPGANRCLHPRAAGRHGGRSIAAHDLLPGKSRRKQRSGSVDRGLRYQRPLLFRHRLWPIPCQRRRHPVHAL